MVLWCFKSIFSNIHVHTFISLSNSSLNCNCLNHNHNFIRQEIANDWLIEGKESDEIDENEESEVDNGEDNDPPNVSIGNTQCVQQTHIEMVRDSIAVAIATNNGVFFLRCVLCKFSKLIINYIFLLE